MKNNKRVLLHFFVLGVFLFIFSSCSDVESTNNKHSFQAATNVEQSIKDFNKVNFETFEDLNLGFFKGNLWIKLDIENEELPKSYMFINNDFLNRNYTFYKLDSLNTPIKLDNHVIDESKQDYRTFNFSNPNFKIDLAANERATFLITSKSDGRTVDATPQMISFETYTTFTNEKMIWSISFLGIIAFLILLNIYQWSIHRQKIYFYCVFYMLCTFFMYLGFEGHLYNFELKHNAIDHLIFISIRLWIFSLIMYTAHFLDIQSVAPRFYKSIKWLLIVTLGGVTLYQFISYKTSIAHLHYFENTLSFLWLFIILVTVFLSAKTRRLELTYYLIPLCSFLLLTTIGLIDGQVQIFPGTPFTYIKIGTIIEFIGFTYFMAILIKKKLKRAEMLEGELNKNRKELITTTERLLEKNKLLSTKSNGKKADLIGIFKILENSLSNETEWSEFKQKFKELNPSFHEELLKNHPDLTKSEIRLLILIRIGYSQKEIASILNIAPDSVKKAKSRVRKKLCLTESITLNEYLLSI